MGEIGGMGMTDIAGLSGTARAASENTLSRANSDSLRKLVIATGLAASVLFVVLGVAYQLQLYADGSLFSRLLYAMRGPFIATTFQVAFQSIFMPSHRPRRMFSSRAIRRAAWLSTGFFSSPPNVSAFLSPLSLIAPPDALFSATPACLRRACVYRFNNEKCKERTAGLLVRTGPAACPMALLAVGAGTEN